MIDELDRFQNKRGMSPEDPNVVVSTLPRPFFLSTSLDGVSTRKIPKTENQPTADSERWSVHFASINPYREYPFVQKDLHQQKSSFLTLMRNKRISLSPFFLETVIQASQHNNTIELRKSSSLGRPGGGDGDDDDKGGIINFFQRTPLPFALICAAQFLSFSPVWVTFMFTTAYFAESVFDGDDTADLGTAGAMLMLPAFGKELWRPHLRLSQPVSPRHWCRHW